MSSERNGFAVRERRPAECSARAGTSAYRCNLVLPGAAKSGTTSLHAILGQHPRICMSARKEPQFFSFDDLFARGAAAHNDLFAGRADATWYGESSQSYFTSETAVERIAGLLNAPKIILMLRHPVDRLLSQYAWNYRRMTELDSLMNAIERRGDTVEHVYDDRINMYREIGGYLAFSRYTRWVPMWCNRFGPGNTLCIRFEDFAARPDAVARRCFEFLDVEPVAVEAPHENATIETVCAIYPRALRSGARLLPMPLKRNRIYSGLKHLYLARRTPAPDLGLDAGQHAWLASELAPDIAFHGSIDRVG